MRRRLEPTRKELETDLTTDDVSISFYRRPSWRGIYWAALFIVAIRRQMRIQKGVSNRLSQISYGIVRFIEAKVSEITSVDTVNDNLRKNRQPHKEWIDALLTSALTYRDIGATIVIVDPNGTRHTVTESFLHHATDILRRHIIHEEEEERVIYLESRTLNDEIRISKGNPTQRLTLHVRSPIGEGDFSISIVDQDKKSEGLYRRLVEEWMHQFDRFMPEHRKDMSDPRQKVMGAATALVEKLGRPPLDEDYEDSAESELFA